jgi:hypothetical protein
MIFRNLTSSGDWTFGYGKSCYATNESAVALNIKTTLACWVGNCPWDMTFGIDWINRLNLNQTKQLEQDLAAAIMQCYGVVKIDSFSVDFNSVTRFASVSYTIDTVYGENFNAQINDLLGLRS